MNRHPPTKADIHAPSVIVVTLTIDELEAVIEQAVSRALNNAPPPRLMYTLREAADQLGVDVNWLAERVRKGEISHRRPGHKIHFSVDDLKQLVEEWKVDAEKGGE